MSRHRRQLDHPQEHSYAPRTTRTTRYEEGVYVVGNSRCCELDGGAFEEHFRSLHERHSLAPRQSSTRIDGRQDSTNHAFEGYPHWQAIALRSIRPVPPLAGPTFKKRITKRVRDRGRRSGEIDHPRERLVKVLRATVGEERYPEWLTPFLSATAPVISVSWAQRSRW
jgi:hypothetical protein